MSRGKPGNPGKGDRAAITLRVPRHHKERYEREAAEKGMPLSDYLSLRLAQSHELSEPPYLQPRAQEELPLGA